jgi:methyl-accepting chemotaxis protein
MRPARLLPAPIRRSYARKFFVAIVVAAIVIAVVGVVGFLQVQTEIEESTEDRLQSNAQLQANAIGDYVRVTKRQTRLHANAQQVREGDSRAVQRYITDAQSRAGQSVIAVHYVDTENEQIVQSTDPTKDGSSLLSVEQPWTSDDGLSAIRGLGTGDVYVTDQSFAGGPNRDTTSLAFVSPVEDRPNRAIVVISAPNFRIDDLYQPETEQSTEILNADNQPILVNESADRERERIDESAVERAQSGERSFVRRNGQAVAFASVPNTNGWVARTSVPESQAFSLQQIVGIILVAIIAASLMMLLAFGGVIARSTVGPLEQLRDRAQAMEQNELDVDLETRREDEIGRLYEAFDSMRVSLREQIAIAEQARQEAEAFTEHLERKADQYREVMRACADGDLTRRVDPESESEAMTEIGTGLNEMTANFEETVARLRSFAADAAAASDEVTDSVEQVKSVSEDVSASVQSISDGAREQDERFQSVSSEMQSLSAATEQIASLSNEVSELSSETADTGRGGREAARETVDGMEIIRANSTRAVGEIEALDEEMAEIDELVDIIDDLASQTNKLALNANIEASRSSEGNTGSGFDVVAEEIRSLAEETQEATDSIEQRIERIREQSSHSVEAVQQAAERVAAETETVKQTAEALEEVAEYANDTNRGVQAITDATQQQAASTQEVVSMVDEAATISDRTVDEADRVAAAAEAQTSSMSEVAESVGELARRAVRLEEGLSQFDVDASDETDRSVTALGDASAAAPADGDEPGVPADEETE